MVSVKTDNIMICIESYRKRRGGRKGARESNGRG
jgi:hypothetical protein